MSPTFDAKNKVCATKKGLSFGWIREKTSVAFCQVSFIFKLNVLTNGPLTLVHCIDKSIIINLAFIRFQFPREKVFSDMPKAQNVRHSRTRRNALQVPAT